MFEPTASAYVYHAVASNWPSETKTAVEVLAWHNQRGQAENFLKELKHGVGMERMPCGETWANAVWFRLGVIAYNLGTRGRSSCSWWAQSRTVVTQYGVRRVSVVYRGKQGSRSPLAHIERVLLWVGSYVPLVGFVLGCVAWRHEVHPCNR